MDLKGAKYSKIEAIDKIYIKLIKLPLPKLPEDCQDVQDLSYFKLETKNNKVMYFGLSLGERDKWLKNIGYSVNGPEEFKKKYSPKAYKPTLVLHNSSPNLLQSKSIDHLPLSRSASQIGKFLMDST